MEVRCFFGRMDLPVREQVWFDVTGCPFFLYVSDVGQLDQFSSCVLVLCNGPVRLHYAPVVLRLRDCAPGWYYRAVYCAVLDMDVTEVRVRLYGVMRRWNACETIAIVVLVLLRKFP